MYGTKTSFSSDPMSSSSSSRASGRGDLWNSSSGGLNSSGAATNNQNNRDFFTNDIQQEPQQEEDFERPISAPPPPFDAFSCDSDMHDRSSHSSISNNHQDSRTTNVLSSLLDSNNRTIGSNFNSKRLTTTLGSSISGTELSSMKDYYHAGNSLTWDSQTFKRMGGFSRLFNATARLEDVDELMTCDRISNSSVSETKSNTSRLEDLFTRPSSLQSTLQSNSTDTVRSLPSSRNNNSTAVSDLQSLFLRPDRNIGSAVSNKTTSQQYTASPSVTLLSADTELHASTITNALSCLNSPVALAEGGTTAPPQMSLLGIKEEVSKSAALPTRHSQKSLIELTHDHGNTNNICTNNSNNSGEQKLNDNNTRTTSSSVVHLTQPQSSGSAKVNKAKKHSQNPLLHGGQIYSNHPSPADHAHNNTNLQPMYQQQQQQQSYPAWSQQPHVVVPNRRSAPQYINNNNNNNEQMDYASGQLVGNTPSTPIMASSQHPQQYSYMPYPITGAQQYASNIPYGSAVVSSQPQPYPSFHPQYTTNPDQQQAVMNAYSPSTTLSYAPVYTTTAYHHPGTNVNVISHPPQQQQQHHVHYSYQQQPAGRTVLYPYVQSVSVMEPQAATYVVQAPNVLSTADVQQQQHYVVVQHTLDGQVILAPTASSTTINPNSNAFSYISTTSSVFQQQPHIELGTDSSRKSSQKGRGANIKSADNKQSSKLRGEKNSTGRKQPALLPEGADSPASLLEEYKRTSKSREWTVRNQVKGHVVEFCQDQNGSRFLQSQLDADNTHVEGPLILQEILENMSAVKNDVFGNYVLQKILDRGNEEMRSKLWFALKGEVMELSLQMYSCRVVQKAVEKLSDENLFDLIEEFRGNVLQLIEDQNGNHVCQKLIEALSKRSKSSMSHDNMDAYSRSIDFIIGDVIANLSRLSCHPYGCRVLQRILEHCVRPQANMVLDEISKVKVVLLGDQYGNYVIQHVLQYGRTQDREGILKLVLEPENGILKLSRQKFASNVVEKLLKYGNSEQRRKLLVEMLKEVKDEETDGQKSYVVLLMVRDPYANYVVQTLLDVAPDGDERQKLLSILNANAEKLRSYTFAKHIVTKLFD